MKKIKKYIAFFFMLYFLASTQAYALDTKALLLQARQEINYLEKSLKDDRIQINQVNTQVLKLEKQISKLSNFHYQTNQNIKQQNSKLNKFTNIYKQQCLDMTQLQTSLEKQLQTIFILKKNPPFKLLMQNVDPGKTHRILGYYHYIYKTNKDRLHQKLLALKNSKQTQASLKSSIHNTNLVLLKQSKELKELSALFTEYKVKLKYFHNHMYKKSQTLSSLEQDEKVLEGKIKKFKTPSEKQIFRDKKTSIKFPPLGKSMQLPLQHFSISNTIRNNSTNSNINRFLLIAKDNAEVKAISHGQVVFADWLRGYGLLLIIDHQDGWMSLYGHNQTIFKEIGDWVNVGELISLVGQSGGQAEPGLYFEVRQYGKSINLIKWLKNESI